MRISDWSSDVCSSDLAANGKVKALADLRQRHDDATQARTNADAALTQASEQRLGVADALSAAKQKVVDARTALDSARTDRQAAQRVLAEGGERIRQCRRGAAAQEIGRAACRERVCQYG